MLSHSSTARSRMARGLRVDEDGKVVSGRVWPVLCWRLVLLGVILGGLSPLDDARAGLNTWTSGGPEGGSITALAVDPQTPGVVYAGNLDVFKSATGGSFWTRAHAGLTNSYTINALVIPVPPPIFLDTELMVTGWCAG